VFREQFAVLASETPISGVIDIGVAVILLTLTYPRTCQERVGAPKRSNSEA